MSAKPAPSDAAVVRDGFITYTALPYPLPLMYKQTLMQLGEDALKGNEEAKRDLDNYERTMRRGLGVPVTRKVMWHGNLI